MTRFALALSVAAILRAQIPHVSLLPDSQLYAIAAEASGALALDTVVALGRYHRVHGSPGFHDAAAYIAAQARENGLEDVHIESFPADGQTTYNSFRSYFGWEAHSAVLAELGPPPRVIADYSKMRVALADYSNPADVTADLIDVGRGTAAADYARKEVKGAIVLAGGNVAEAHHQAVELRGAAGVLSYQPNQTTGWSGDYPDLVRWGHLSPYNLHNTFAFMISLRNARELQSRLASGEKIRVHAQVDARMRPGAFEVVTGVIRGADPASGEIVFSSHLCHQKPGANDDASGAATILEDARLLARLIADGKLPRPRRTIRFLWAPEIAGTMCYLARHPADVRRMTAAIHMDMVGGDPRITKAIFHVTHTPASLPSFVNDVAEVFAGQVIDGSKRAAEDGDFGFANFSPEGSKEPLVADFHSFTMGSDHDVYQEGSFRVPTIYLNDWPDVFIHTNGDVPSNLDPTKLQRVAIIGAASGYFIASADDNQKALAGEVFARAAGRQEEALRLALAMPDLRQAYNAVHQAAAQAQAALRAVVALAPETDVRHFERALSAHATEALAILAEMRGSPPPRDEKSPVPHRNPAVIGNLEVYYYDYLQDHLKPPVEPALRGTLAYEALNLVDGKRSLLDIRDVLEAAYGSVPAADLSRYFDQLAAAGVVTLR